MKAKLIIFALLIIFLSSIASAHQPRLIFGNNESNPLSIDNPEVSKAYYSELTGEPAFYTINSEKSFELYLNILVPDVADARDKRFSVIAFNSTENIAFLNGTAGNWTSFYEPFGQDSYLMGPEFRATVPAGNYTIEVFNDGNQGKYILAVGEVEEFPAGEIINAIVLMPMIKLKIFNNPVPIISVIIAIVAIAIIAVFLIRWYIKRLERKSIQQPTPSQP